VTVDPDLIDAMVERAWPVLADKWHYFLFEQCRRHPDVYRMVARSVIEAALTDPAVAGARD
jgi:hypothetical protein